MWYIFDHLAEPQHPGEDQDQSREQRGDEQPVIAMDRDHVEDHDHEGASRAADLDTRSAERRDQDDLRTIDGGADGRLDPTPRVAEQEGFVFVGVAVFVGLDLLGIPHQQGRHGRNEGEGEDEGPDQGQHHRRPHGDEGLALHPLKHQQGREDQQDNQLTEGGRLDHLASCGHGDIEAFPTGQGPSQIDPPLR